MYIKVMVGGKIAKEMNFREYITPSKYYYDKHLERGRIYGHKVQINWTVDMVSNILKNEIYTGTLITHKKQTVGIRGRAKKLPIENHFRFENHHEAIISKELFDTAQRIRQSRNNKVTVPEQREYLFKGFTKCGECNGSASGKSIKRANGRIKGYCCCRYISQGVSSCKASEIPEDLILAHFKEFLKQTMVTYRDILKTIDVGAPTRRCPGSCGQLPLQEQTFKKLKQRQERLEQEMQMLISERIKDLVSSKDNNTRDLITKTYKELEENKKLELLEINKRLEELSKIDKTELKKQLLSSTQCCEQILQFDVPPYYLLEQVLDKIYIYRDKSIKFELKLNIDNLCA